MAYSRASAGSRRSAAACTFGGVGNPAGRCRTRRCPCRRASALTSARTTNAFSVPSDSARRIGGTETGRCAERAQEYLRAGAFALDAAVPAVRARARGTFCLQAQACRGLGPAVAERKGCGSGRPGDPHHFIARTASLVPAVDPGCRRCPRPERKTALVPWPQSRLECLLAQLRCRSGSGIFTGQTTPHWLHIVDAANKSCALSSPTYIGVRIDPIGPRYTQPYEWPPTFW